jgi:hypothetical protein
MRANLHLVKGSERDFKALAATREDRYRYPAEEEVGEVSCEPDRDERPKLKLLRRSS